LLPASGLNARRVAGVHDLVRCCGDPVVDSPHGLFRPALAGNKGEEVSLLVAEGEEDGSLQLSESWLHDAGSPAITYSCNA
jgi:hypothetical protein